MHHDIIVIGGSAGAVDSMMQIAAGLPSGLPASLFVVIHIAATSKGELAWMLNRASYLECVLAEDKTPIRQGCIYLARPDHHLLIESGRIRITRGPKENHTRPAIDPLFRSAAAAFGPRVIGVVLSGMLDDGAQGLAAIKRAGGLAVVQLPTDTRFPSMPMNACLAAEPDYKVTVEEMPALLGRLVREPAGEARAEPLDQAEAQVAANRMLPEEAMRELGQPSVFSCPECDGVLFEIRDSGMIRFRCSIGHAYGAHSLLACKDGGVEEALSASLRALHESERLSRQLIENLVHRGFPLTIQELEAKARDARRNASVIQAMLEHLADIQEAEDSEK